MRWARLASATHGGSRFTVPALTRVPGCVKAARSGPPERIAVGLCGIHIQDRPEEVPTLSRGIPARNGFGRVFVRWGSNRGKPTLMTRVVIARLNAPELDCGRRWQGSPSCVRRRARHRACTEPGHDLPGGRRMHGPQPIRQGPCPFHGDDVQAAVPGECGFKCRQAGWNGECLFQWNAIIRC